MLDPKSTQMFYFTGKKQTTPNYPVELVPNFNPSAGVPSYRNSDRACTRNAEYFIPFFLERPGPRCMQWSVNAHEARPGHHTQVRTSQLAVVNYLPANPKRRKLSNEAIIIQVTPRSRC